jgi:hypothetical protein
MKSLCSPDSLSADWHSRRPFFKGLLKYYGIEYLNLNPNGIFHISVFVHFCEAFVGTAIIEAVPVEGVVPEAEVITGSASGPAKTAAPEITEEVHDDALLETNMDVVVRSPEIQDVELIRSAPMSDDLINPAMVAHNLESMLETEQWMKVRDGTLE